MSEHDSGAAHAGAAATRDDDEASADHSPIEALTSLVLDAADAANDSAQSTSHAISELAKAVASNREATAAMRNAPAIFGAITLGIGVVLSVLVAVVITRINQQTAGLEVAIKAQTEQFHKVEDSLKELKAFEGTLEDFKGVAADTTQRAMVMLREQVKTDRLALQQLEVRRLEEMIHNASGAAGGGKAEPAALEKSLARIDSRIEELAKAVARAAQVAATPAKPAQRSDAPPKELKAMQDDLLRVKEDVGVLRASLEKAGAPGPASQSGMPAYKKP